MNLNKFKKLKSPYVILTIAPPLCGKSFFCKKFTEIINKDVEIISRDQIMLDIWGNSNYTEAFKNVNQRDVNKALSSKLKAAADLGLDVIVDMTNLFSKRRKTTLGFFGDDYDKIGVIFPLPSEKELESRNIKRFNEEQKNISKSVLDNMISSYQPIKDSEGFTKIISL